MSIELTPQQNQRIASLIASGNYRDVASVIDAGLSYAEQHKKYIDWLRSEAQIGTDAIERGDYVQFDDVEDLIAHLDGISSGIVAPTRTP